MTKTGHIAHIRKNPDGSETVQTVYEHLTETASLAASYAEAFGCAEQGRLAGMAHDIGKYSAEFQKRLHGGVKVDHASAGAYECVKAGQPFAAFCVSGHHGGLPDMGSRTDTAFDATLNGRLQRARSGGLPDYSAWKNEVKLPSADVPAFLREAPDPLKDMFFTRMLYSCLVDADYRNTADFMTGKAEPESEKADFDAMCEKLDLYTAPWFPPNGKLNELRCDILKSCESGALTSKGLFTLTVPTGGGKTVASLSFALRHAKEHGMSRVIYVIPYTSIIEQTAAKFREILGDDAVLEHHSGVFRDVGEEETESDEIARLNNAAENWDADVIVTTAVQFFESFFSNRPSRCRKLHNVADSVIVLDEAQMLPLAYLRACVYAISQLVAHYGASAVLCTATQPSLGRFFADYLPGVAPVELCPENCAADDVFKRVTFRWEGVLSWDALAEHMNAQRQALCIVNRRASAKELYEKLKKDGVFHLTTYMYPAHRRAVLKEIKQRLKDGKPCLVVATSLIEAGVDVDFPAVFRESAGLDSILQAAGRCNREGTRSREESIVTVFAAEASVPQQFRMAEAVGRGVFTAHTEDPSASEAIECYFEQLYDIKGDAALDERGIMKLSESRTFPFKTIDERFKLIDDRDTRTVYIPCEENREDIEELLAGNYSRALFRKLGQYGVSVFSGPFDAMCGTGIFRLLPCGNAVLVDESAYDSSTGLQIKEETGNALFT